MALSVVKREKTLSEQAYDIIKGAIISNEFKPGQPMIEEMLAEQLSISRTPIRAALKQLQFEGILVPTEGKNLAVSNITSQDVYDVGIVRATLESLAISLLKSGINPSGLALLEKKVEEQRQALESGDDGAVEYLQLDYDFHVLIAQLSGNSFLVEMIEKVNFLTRRFLTLSGTLGKYSRTAIEEHEAVIQSLRDGQIEKASAYMAEHIEKSYHRMLVV